MIIDYRVQEIKFTGEQYTIYIIDKHVSHFVSGYTATIKVILFDSIPHLPCPHIVELLFLELTLQLNICLLI